MHSVGEGLAPPSTLDVGFVYMLQILWILHKNRLHSSLLCLGRVKTLPYNIHVRISHNTPGACGAGGLLTLMWF